jgi:hypothetical protein
MPKFWQVKPALLLLPNIPKPLHGVNPRTVLGSSWWNSERKLAYASTNYHCEACGIHKEDQKERSVLEGHEVYDIDYKEGTSTYVRTTPLCPSCHQYIHDGRLLWLLNTGQITRQHYSRVIRHGDSILRVARLTKLSLQEKVEYFTELHRKGQIAPWSKWRMIVNGVSWSTPYKDAKDYNEKYSSDRYGNNRVRLSTWMPTIFCDDL